MEGYPSESNLTTLPPVPMRIRLNEVPLTRKLLKQLLSDLSERLYRSFKRQVRLVVHGGAVMVLHPLFAHRESTQDVNYIHRSFVSEYRALGYPDAEQRLRTCIVETARKFGLGADWMNDHADVALPWALDPQGRTYDPIFYASTQQQNAVPQTIFNERGLALVAVPWPWAIALKLARYANQDSTDCAAVLRLGVAQRGVRWTLVGLEEWITKRCWPMGYAGYQPQQMEQLRQRMQDTLNRAFPPGSHDVSVTKEGGESESKELNQHDKQSDTSQYQTELGTHSATPEIQDIEKQLREKERHLQIREAEVQDVEEALRVKERHLQIREADVQKMLHAVNERRQAMDVQEDNLRQRLAAMKWEENPRPREATLTQQMTITREPNGATPESDLLSLSSFSTIRNSPRIRRNVDISPESSARLKQDSGYRDSDVVSLASTTRGGPSKYTNIDFFSGKSHARLKEDSEYYSNE